MHSLPDLDVSVLQPFAAACNAFRASAVRDFKAWRIVRTNIERLQEQRVRAGQGTARSSGSSRVVWAALPARVLSLISGLQGIQQAAPLSVTDDDGVERLVFAERDARPLDPASQRLIDDIFGPLLNRQ